MLENELGFIDQFVLLWVVVEPVSVVTIFLSLTAGMPATARRAVALKAVAVAAAVIVFFIALGQILLEALGVDLVAFQIAGGIVLFLFALTMIFGRGSTVGGSGPSEPPRDIAIFPLGMPAIAGPGVMLAVVLLTDNHQHSFLQQVETAAVAGIILLVTLAALILADPIHRLLGIAGASVVSRVSGLILSAIAVNGVLGALRVYFGPGG